MKKKIVLIVSLILCFVLASCGCLRVNKEQKAGNKAIAYIEGKYGKTFTPLSYDFADYLSNEDMVECYTEGMDPDKEHVTIFIDNENGKVKYRDNYFGFLIRDEMEAYVNNIVTKEFPECKSFVAINIDSFPDELDYDNHLEDLYRVQKDYWMTVTVFIKADENIATEDYQEKTSHIVSELQDSKHRYTFAIYAVNQDYYDGLERYKQEDFWNQYFSNENRKEDIYIFEQHKTIIDGEQIR